MARAPLIDSPCPLRVTSLPTAGRDHCGHCDRQVHNLDGMSTAQREAFLKSCTGKVCVAYTVHRKAARRNAVIGATLVATLAGSGLAMAQETPTLPPKEASSTPINTVDVASVESSTILTSEQIAKIPVPRNITAVGGISDASTARWADESELDVDEQQALPEIDELEWLPSKPQP